MKIKGLAGAVIKTAATFFATVVLVCSLALFAVPATPVAAKVGQPDIPVPALSDVHCASYCVYDKTTGYIVISMNPEDRIYPASMTKIMTCLLSLELLDTSEKITVSANVRTRTVMPVHFSLLQRETNFRHSLILYATIINTPAKQGIGIMLTKPPKKSNTRSNTTV